MMCRPTRFWGWGILVLVLALLTPAGAQDIFRDDFDVAHDFLADGVGDSGWDGFFGAGNNETADVITINIDRPGMLYMESTGGNWDSFSPYGPFLYKIAEGDFKITTYVGDFAGEAGALVLHNDAFLMARVPDIDDAGPGEDFECMHYFPTWVGNMGRSYDDGVESEWGGTGNNFGAAQYIQLERVGNTFHYRFSTDGVTWTELNGSPVVREDMAGPLQVGVAQCNYNNISSYAAFEFVEIEGVPSPDKPRAPRPLNKAEDVDRDTTLTWLPGPHAGSEVLYFGTDADAVANATVDDPQGVLVVQDLAGYEYVPAELLEYGQTYYWRIDDVNQTEGKTYSGDVWQFTVEPYAYLLSNVTATASHSTAKSPAANTVNGSGLVDGLHTTNDQDAWSTGFLLAPEPVWLQWDLNEPAILSEMRVWNGNPSFEKVLGVGVNEISLEVSLDGVDWQTLEQITHLNQAPASDDYACNNFLDLQNVEARYVRMNVLSNFGGPTGHMLSYMLAEVQFFSIPVAARQPQPASGATARELDVELVWRTGRKAASHRVYLGTDANAVAAADPSVLYAEVTDRRLQLTGLEYDRQYFWRVDEVNDTLVWPGEVWSFSTPETFVVDDFESYSDNEPTRVFDTWVDGWNTPSTNGAVVGYATAPFMEEDIVLVDGQSMPYSYNNAGGTITSEATLPLNGQDWTRGGITALVFYVLGEKSNTGGQLYVKINGTKVPCTANLSSGLWTRVVVDLPGSGANLTSVNSLTIGVEGSGQGQLYIDEIRLYREAPPAVVPTDPQGNGLILHYRFENDLSDSSGNGYTATESTGVTYVAGVEGQALSLDGIDDYVDVPFGPVVPTLTDCTFSVWVNINPDSTANWARVFDFGTDTTNYMFLTPRAGATSGAPEFEITSPTGGLADVNAGMTLTDGWHHLAVVIQGNTLRLYVDAIERDSDDTTTLPQDLGQTPNNWLGQSQFAADDLFWGLLDEFKVYNRALSEGEIRYLAGDR